MTINSRGSRSEDFEGAYVSLGCKTLMVSKIVKNYGSKVDFFCHDHKIRCTLWNYEEYIASDKKIGKTCLKTAGLCIKLLRK